MKLLFTVCVPIVTYSCEADIYSAKQKNAFNIALNDAIRRIFSYNRWESVRFLRLSMGYPSFTDICYRPWGELFAEYSITRQFYIEISHAAAMT